MVPADRDGRVRAFDELFRAHYRAVQAYVASRYPEADSAAIMSTTFEIAWRRFDDLPAAAARGWLIGVARNCARNELRADRRRRRHLGVLEAAARRRPAELSADAVVTSGTVDSLRVAFERLSEAEREVLLLAEWDGLTGADLGAALGVRANVAAVRLHRARARLRAAFLEGSES